MAKKKRKPGRPKATNPKDQRMQFVVDAKTADRYYAAADAEGMLFSEWVRHHLDRIASKTLGE